MNTLNQYIIEYSEEGKIIKFLPNTRRLPNELPSGEIYDLSQCVKLELKEHDFQHCLAKTIILPTSIKELPYYSFSRCPNLQNLLGGKIKSIKRGALEEQCPLNNCPSLERIQFSEELSDEDILRQILQIKLGPYSRGRHGFVIYTDDEYSYIWCFNVRKFYYVNKMQNKDRSFVKFNHPIRRDILIENGTCRIVRGNEWFVDTICEESKQIIWSPYPGFSERRTDDGFHPYWVDVQSEAVCKFHELEGKLKEPLVDVIQTINQKVDSLDIEAIIDGYKTTYSHEIHDRVGGDVREEFYKGRSSFYNDGYLETILPTYRNYSIETGYGYSMNYYSKEDMDAANNIDAEYRLQARKKYNKEEHKRFLIDEYVRKMVEDAKFIERCLNIETAKQMLKDTSHLKGEEKILYLNDHIRI